MRIGIDFDNTLVSYDALFHRVALEQGLIPADLAVSKLAVRDHLRRAGREPLWTEMQGLVYGARMDEAAMFPGAREFLLWARANRLATSIISHKTRHPFAGPRYDLHEVSRAWVAHHLRDGEGPLLDPSNVFFELTKEEKLERVRAWGCTHFVDDLPEILLAEGFPPAVERILFDPDGHHAGLGGVVRAGDWRKVRGYFEGAWAVTR